MSACAVRIEIDTPIVLHDLLHLDALLARVVTDAGGDADDLPLASTDGLWHASALLLETGAFGAVETEESRIKSLRKGQFPDDSLDHVPISRRSIGPMSPLRPRLTTHRPLSGVTAIWSVFDGDAKAVVDLLDDVLYFGAHHRVGRGRRSSDAEVFPVVAPGPVGVVLANGLPARAVPLRTWDTKFVLPHHPNRCASTSSWRPDYRESEKDVCVLPAQRDLTGTRTEIMGLIGA